MKDLFASQALLGEETTARDRALYGRVGLSFSPRSLSAIPKELDESVDALLLGS